MTSAPTTPLARPDTDDHEHLQLQLRLRPTGPVSGSRRRRLVAPLP